MHALATLRRSRSLSFFDLALLTGIPARALAEAELGVRRLTPAEREQLAFVLGLGAPDITGAHRRAGAIAANPRRPLRPALVALLAATLAATAATATRTDCRATACLPQPQALAHALQPLFSSPLAPIAQAAQVAQAAPPAAQPAAPQPDRPAAQQDHIAPVAPTLYLVPVPRAAPAPQPAFVMSESGPVGCPVQPTSGAVVLTQGYGVGSHAPAEVWGAVDLAIDGDGDGQAEPEASWYAPVVATHAGVVRVTLDSDPAGNHVWVSQSDGPWRTGYAHLAIVTVISGQSVRAGEQIGLIGSSGVSSGPHLDYQVWSGEVNVDPTGLVGCV